MENITDNVKMHRQHISFLEAQIIECTKLLEMVENHPIMSLSIKEQLETYQEKLNGVKNEDSYKRQFIKFI